MAGTASFRLYDLRDAHSLLLRERPRLASWDAATAPSQLVLGRYLDHVGSLLSNWPSESTALHLTVGDDPAPVRAPGSDLDNYLYPVMRRLGSKRYVLARASKSAWRPSTIAVGRAVPRTGLEPWSGWRFASVATTASAETRVWKEQIYQQLSAAVSSEDHSVGTPQPVAMEIAFRVGPRRNWINLWKPAIDSTGPVVGEGSRPFAPRDDLIHELGLHLEVDERLGHQVEIGFWWNRTHPTKPTAEERS